MNEIVNKKIISVSILDAKNIELFLDELYKIKINNNLENIIIHFDIMDKHFVKCEGISLEHIKIAKKYGFIADVHLMVEDTEIYINRALELGADNITIHYEISDFETKFKVLKNLVNKNSNTSIGISLKPSTDIECIKKYKNEIDLVLIMSVEPGLGGQTYDITVNDKILNLKGFAKFIEVDGGININTIEMPLENGANIFVIGSYLTRDIDKLKEHILILEEKIINT